MDQSTLQAFAVLAETYSEKPRVVGLDLRDEKYFTSQNISALKIFS